jgi:hypothetical protein
VHPEVERLARLVEATVNFLTTYGETHWSAWLARDAARIRARDYNGLKHLLSAFGGMGSITDLLLHPANGHKISEAEIDHVNDRLRSMLNEVHELALRLSKEEE